MRRFRQLFSLAILGAAVVAAHADTIPAGVYYLNNAYVVLNSTDYFITGTVTFNSAGLASAANLTFQDPAFDNPGLPTFDVINTSNAYSDLGQAYIVGNNYGTGQVTLYADATPDSNGYYNLCLNNGPCGTSTGNSALQIYGYYDSATKSNVSLNLTNLSAGYLSTSPSTPPSATPEPSSLALLGTGILGVAEVVRRRFLRG